MCTSHYTRHLNFKLGGFSINTQTSCCHHTISLPNQLFGIQKNNKQVQEAFFNFIWTAIYVGAINGRYAGLFNMAVYTAIKAANQNLDYLLDQLRNHRRCPFYCHVKQEYI